MSEFGTIRISWLSGTTTGNVLHSARNGWLEHKMIANAGIGRVGFFRESREMKYSAMSMK